MKNALEWVEIRHAQISQVDLYTVLKSFLHQCYSFPSNIFALSFRNTAAITNHIDSEILGRLTFSCILQTQAVRSWLYAVMDYAGCLTSKQPLRSVISQLFCDTLMCDYFYLKKGCLGFRFKRVPRNCSVRPILQRFEHISFFVPRNRKRLE